MSKKKPTKKTTSNTGRVSQISAAEYNKMLNSGYMFSAREMNADAVRANQFANMYMTPGFGLAGRRTAKGRPPRPHNPNRRRNT